MVDNGQSNVFLTALDVVQERIMKPIDRKKEKLLQCIVFFVRNTNCCGVTKLCKLLSFIDFEHYYKTGKTVTGQEYLAAPLGPVPISAYKEVTQNENRDLGLYGKVTTSDINGFQKIEIPEDIQFNKGIFSAREFELLEEISERYKDTRAEEIVGIAHVEGGPWDRTYKEKGEWSSIDIDSVFISLSEGDEHLALIRQWQCGRNVSWEGS